ncbi:MAG: gliding motility-associated C-terminal domain-containing protein [Paludibacteraceae bacterium]|nr:gliding motility-associated C-terminal domain-containing protein [Paludibacteraceae bacterium]
MKKLFFIPLILVSIGWCSAASLVRAVSISGTYYEAQGIGADHIYIFKNANDASFETVSGGMATWTELATGNKAQGMSTFIDVEDGKCYMVEDGGKTETFVFVDYSLHRLSDCVPDIEMGCSKTLIQLKGWTPMIYYTDSMNEATGQYDVKATLPMTVAVGYSNQQWGEDDWQTVSIEDTVALTAPQVELDSILCDTRFSLSESDIAVSLYSEADSISTEIMEAVAVAHHQQYYIAKRGKTLENEKEGPYEDQTIAHSAPLNVLFESHPSAKADVYTWTVSRGKDVRTMRNDKDIRYTFDEASESGPVTFMVDLQVLNSSHPECVATAQDTITINSSLILVPNVFTPNGDGANDEFRVVYRSICEFHCWVYNRWQHLVYSWDDPAKGWDGTVNGRKMPDSAYLYIIDATGCDGQRFKLKGTVNLLRGE